MKSKLILAVVALSQDNPGIRARSGAFGHADVDAQHNGYD